MDAGARAMPGAIAENRTTPWMEEVERRRKPKPSV